MNRLIFFFILGFNTALIAHISDSSLMLLASVNAALFNGRASLCINPFIIYGVWQFYKIIAANKLLKRRVEYNHRVLSIANQTPN
jgi:hypothetical protein